MKRVLGFVWVMVMLIGMSAFAAMEFEDVGSDDWFYENVATLVDAGIIAGYGNGQFGPEDSMNVDAFIKTMVVALGDDPGNGEDYWAQTYIDAAMDLGIVEAGDFDEYARTITREEMSMLSVRTVEALEGVQNYIYDTEDNDTLLSGISDRGDISSSEGEGYISHAYELGILTGYPDGSFGPGAGLKRSEAATVILRVIDDSYRKPYEEPETVDISDVMKSDLEGEWAERAQEIYDDSGYVVFLGSSPQIEGQVVTDDVLRYGGEGYSFESGLRYNDTNTDDGAWSIFFIQKAVRLLDNKEEQLFELEYILSEIWDVDQSIIDSILIKIDEVLNDGGSVGESWTMASGAEIRFKGTDNLSNIIVIDAIGFPE